MTKAGARVWIGLVKMLINIDYYMLRTWYRFYSRVFNTIAWTSESSSEYVNVYYILRTETINWLKDASKLVLNNSTSWENLNWQISSSETFTNLEAAISLIKLQSSSFRQRRLKYNVEPNWSKQIITVYLIGQFKPWSDMISFHCGEMISSRVSFLVTAFWNDIHTWYVINRIIKHL